MSVYNATFPLTGVVVRDVKEERLKTMELFNKMKASAGILSMVAATGLVSMPVPVTVRAEASVQTAAPAEVDWETINWKEKTYPNRQPLSPEDAEIMWKRVQKEPQFQALPQVFKDLVEHNKEMYKMYGDSNVNTFVFDKQGGGVLFESSVVRLAFNNRGGLTIDINKLKAMKLIDEPVETPAVNPKTKKYYVLPSRKTIRALSGADLAYVKAFTEVVNRNIHYLGSSPVPRLDMKRVKRGEYIGMYMWPLSLVQPKVLYESDDTPSKRANKKAINKTHAQLVDYFAGGDEETYRLQNILGTPLYAPRTFAPEAGAIANLRDCYGRPTPEILGVNMVSLGQARQVTDPERVLNFAYKRYFEAVVASCHLLKSGMAQEVGTLDKKSARYRAVNEVVGQATKYLAQIEKAAEKYIAQADRIYKNPPHTLLNAKGTGKPRTVQRATTRRPQRQFARQYE